VGRRAVRPVVDRMVAAFQKRRDVVVGARRRIDGVSCAMPEGAFYVFPNIGPALEKLGLLRLHDELPEVVQARTGLTEKSGNRGVLGIVNETSASKAAMPAPGQPIETVRIIC
jgi:hypothetical protein